MAVCILLMPVMPSFAAHVSDIRLGRHDGFVRCVIELDSKPVFSVHNASGPEQTVSIDLRGVTRAPSRIDMPEDSGFVKDHKVDLLSDYSLLRLYLRTNASVRAETMTMQDPWRLVVDLHEESTVTTAAAPAILSDGFRPRVVVVDPGHGGKHRGGIGKVRGRTVTEADVTLPLAFELEKLLAADPMFVPILTRRRDTYVGLRDRTRVAERANGNLFLSIHYNAVPPSSRSNARGMEFWVWSPKEVDNVATRYLMKLDNEEGSDTTVSGTSKSARSVLSRMLLDSLEEQALSSRVFAKSLERAFLKDRYFKSDYRGIKDGRFKVLENYNMPSVLIEVGFISHSAEARLSTQKEFQRRVARHMYNGIVDYYMRNDGSFRAARLAPRAEMAAK